MLTFNPINIDKIKIETPSTKTFVFNYPVKPQPGQFIMLTDYATGEKPFSFSRVTPDSFEITIRNAGRFTATLCGLKEGDELYFRGPYGKAFELPAANESAVIIGGGCGTAPMRFLLEHIIAAGCIDITFINGARNASEILFRNELEKHNINLITVTDDGSYGSKQNCAEALAELLRDREFDTLYTAGPELMMKAVFDLTGKLPVKSSFLLERYMKCGIGICGQCTLDPLGIRMCVEGPVVNGPVLAQLTEFGNYTRDAYGARKSFKSIECA